MVEDRLALHDGHRGDGPDVPKAQNPRPVSADGDAAPYHGQLPRQRGVPGDRGARPRHPRGVDVAHILHRPDGVGRLDHELPALVFEERPIACPQDLDAFQLAKHTDDPLGLVPILDLKRDLAYRSFAADVYSRHVPDQTVSFRYRLGDLGQLPRAVRHLDAIRVVEWQSKPPDVPALRLRPYVIPRFLTPCLDSKGGRARRPRSGDLLFDYRDGFDLDEEPGVYERGDLDHRGRRIGLIEVPPPDLVDLIVEPHIRNEDGHLDYVVHPAACLLDHSLHMLEDRLRLALYVSLSNHVAFCVKRNLSRDVDHAPRRSLDSRGERTPTHGRRQAWITDHTPGQNDLLTFVLLSGVR